MPEPIDPPVTYPADPPVDPVDPYPTDPPADPVDPDPEGAEALGDPGKKALDAMKQRLAAEKAAKKALQEQLAALTAKPAGDKTPEDYQREADERATAKANERVLKADIRAAAKEILVDPSDAFLNLDISQFEAGADGEFDAEEIADALKALVERKPHLGKTPAGQPGNPAPRTVAPAKAGGTPKTPTLDERIAKAAADGNVDLQISLQNMKLANAGR